MAQRRAVNYVPFLTNVNYDEYQKNFKLKELELVLDCVYGQDVYAISEDLQ